MKAKDYIAAAIEMEDSRWYYQVGERAKQLQHIILNGWLFMKTMVRDVLTDRKGKYCGFKFTYIAGFFVMTFCIIYTVLHEQLTVDLILAYMGLIGGTSMVSKGLSRKPSKMDEGRD
jgi:hypothetical protein